MKSAATSVRQLAKNLKPGDAFAYKNIGFGLLSYEEGGDAIGVKKGRLFTDTFSSAGMEWNGSLWQFDGGLGMVTQIVPDAERLAWLEAQKASKTKAKKSVPVAPKKTKRIKVETDARGRIKIYLPARAKDSLEADSWWMPIDCSLTPVNGYRGVWVHADSVKDGEFHPDLVEDIDGVIEQLS